MKLGNDLNADQYKLLNALMDPRTADPATPGAGQVWFRSDLKQLCFWDGNAVQRISLTALAGNAPVGQITEYGGLGAPSGWLLCDGSAVSRGAYPDLFSVIGTTFGAGDGSTTFNLPDFRGRSPLGVGTGTGLSARALAAKGGEENHTLTAAESGMPSHGHGISDPGHNHGAPLALAASTGHGAGTYTSWVAGTDGWAGAGANNGSYIPTGTTGIGVNSSGAVNASSSHNTMHPFLAVNFVIKAVAGSGTGSTVGLKYATTLATSATSYVVTHNLGTTDVTTSVRDTTTGAEVTATVEHTDVNTVTVRFTNAPTANTRRVVVMG